MTEIPDHLLQRSRERRAALGLDGGDGGGSAAPAAAATPAAASAAESAPAKPAAAAPAPVAEDTKLAEERARRRADDERRREALRRNRIPVWAAPALLALPVWGMLYAGSFGERAHEEEALTGPALGAQVYAANCASCHGDAGEGGAGPALADGEAVLTFPEEADHVTWVEEGSITKARGTPYGDPNRAGGQRTVQAAGMPGFAGTLSPEEIEAVVAHEREAL